MAVLDAKPELLTTNREKALSETSGLLNVLDGGTGAASPATVVLAELEDEVTSLASRPVKVGWDCVDLDRTEIDPEIRTAAMNLSFWSLTSD